MNKTPVIEINGVSKSFKDVKAVNHLSLTIYEGEYVALLGPNGAGKTTLIEMIEGIQKPDEGSIAILGMSWKTHAQKLHRAIGLSLQETRFIDKITTEETLNLFGSFYGLGQRRTEEILDLVNLKEKRKAYTVTLSGGQKQRLALGIALLNNPKILLLDEPTTGLDPAARREIWKILEKLRSDLGTTMILTTHYMEEAEVLCERILIMDKGQFIAQGTLSELNAKHGEGDLIEISFGNNFDIEALGLSGIKKLNWIAPHTKVQIFVDNIAEVLPAVINSAKTKNIKIEELLSRKMTLDDLFISMTGRHLHD
ncbi:ABC transporter ATP-binding protein [Fulvivirgaceae bacterium PWU4]|uniref:ABC transporter ATP-binding protein n=1 Tax=Chryseosolibacter histidini TaxID=2782349 RepID=A0AAP2DI73_9BACT|nr:ABC transporter ATP-binding protein [Chryseosolibacter histidini]MBT1695672.1 ABC transporter ATP-binding protein [Chryseosolibacter histidini]